MSILINFMGSTERERFILHISVLEMIKEQHDLSDSKFREMLGRITKERCRHLSHEEQEEIISDMADEFLSSKNALDSIEDDIKRVMM